MNEITIQQRIDEVRKESDSISTSIIQASLYLNENLNSFFLMFGPDMNNRGFYFLHLYVDVATKWIDKVKEILNEIQLKLDKKIKEKEEIN